METLNEIRQALEGAMSKDEKLFTKRIGDQFDVGEKELEQTAMFWLSEWRRASSSAGTASMGFKAGIPCSGI